MMKIITYLGLTLLSILIQFTLMDYIKEKNIETDEDMDKMFDLNVTSRKKQIDDIFRGFTQKRQALYYRTHDKYIKETNLSPSTTPYHNSTLPEVSLETSTGFSTMVVDELYDDNNVTTTDLVYTSTEIDNETEITFFDKKHSTTMKPKSIPKKDIYIDCRCNLLYKVCDINCCCDSDCTESDIKMFLVCNENIDGNTDQSGLFCYPQISNSFTRSDTKYVDNMFCVAKTNLPVKRKVDVNKYEANPVERSYKWHKDIKQRHINVFKRRPYSYGDPMWVLKDGVIKYMDLPSPIVNSYCTSRRPLRFLKDETVSCKVKLKDLEMFHILKASEDVNLVSVLENTLNSSYVNCSSLHCVNWTIIACNDVKCVPYNKSLHEPTCSESDCKNIAYNFDYIFYYYESKITKAIIKLYIQKISTVMPFLLQNIDIRFVIANETIDNIVQMSGNPGYTSGLPVIASFTESNHSYNFFHTSNKKYLSYSLNQNGNCVLSNVTNNYVTFQSNKRMKCRYQYMGNNSSHNYTEICKNLQEKIKELLGLNYKIFISPYGNPLNTKDDEWVPMQKNMSDNELVYGNYNDQNSKLHCYNMIMGASLIFTYADISEKEGAQILTAQMDMNMGNITFNIDIGDISIVLTTDIIFLDQTKPSIYEYAAGPQLNVRLPGDFFFPFPSSGSFYRHNALSEVY
ncbi:tectonic-1-like [Aphomia sociella]